eukprot:TRINITY_DN13938_c0_g1_i1.p1 TRINITY_DN13938_c0_g1~~TRINITY_DN13938_c0_g1_i1.p1  ORF type:complete len:544 (-),score=142.93 TRINITY_DN13938_c0_g1_i1:41-1672(-)
MSLLLGRSLAHSNRFNLLDARCSRNSMRRGLHQESPFSGKATQRGTTKYGQSPNQSNRLGFSPFALEMNEELLELDKEEEKIEKLIKRGLVNVLEINSKGDSDTITGRLLNRFKTMGSVEREELILMSRGGNLEGNLLGSIKYALDNGRKFEGIREINKRLWYCNHPEVLEHTITQTIKILNVESLDCFLLETPKFPTESDEVFEEHMEEFMKSLKPAFEHLEREVEYGRIQTYGISLHDCNNPNRLFSESRFEEMMKIASGIKKYHNFSLIQFPLNVLENLPISLRKYDNGAMNLSELASKWGLTRLTSRPLEVIDSSKIEHLVTESYTRHEQTQLLPQLQNAVNDVIGMEFHYSELVKTDKEAPPATEAAWAITLASNPTFAHDHKQFKFFRDNFAEPGILSLAQKLSNHRFSRWAKEYREKSLSLLDIFELINEANSHYKSQDIKELLESVKEFRGESNLPQKALDFLWASKATDCIILNPRESGIVINQLESRRDVSIDKERWDQLLEDGTKLSKELSNHDDEMPEEALDALNQMQSRS